MSKDMLLGVTVTLAASAATAGAGAMYIAYDLLKKGHSKHKGYIDSCIAPCTCKQGCRPRQRHDHQEEHKWTPCKRHDQKLLHEISKVISNCDLMWGQGINLGIDAHAIEAFYVDNRDSINRAAFVMLLQWYTEHKELKIAELKDAMNKVHLGQHTEKIDKHFEERWQ